ncbi:MAG: lytic transglycosylase domain-containing protein [Magnetococcales bacterium]|nr:lytic transglycosylase domain-containing protein [Magnetococcales bacterium]
MLAYAHSYVKTGFLAIGAPPYWREGSSVGDRWRVYGYLPPHPPAPSSTGGGGEYEVAGVRGVLLLLLILILLLPLPAVAVVAVDVAELHRMVQQVARDEGVDAALLTAVVANESAFNPRAVSHKGAMGLMQLMPGTANDLGVRNPFDPEENLRGGARYLRAMLERFNNLRLALAAYNAGPNHVVQYQGVPPFEETRRYINRVLYHYYYGTPERVLNRSALFRYQNPEGRTVLASRVVQGNGGGGGSQRQQPTAVIRVIHRDEPADDSYTALRRIIITDRLPAQNRPNLQKMVSRSVLSDVSSARFDNLGAIVRDLQ